MNSFINEFIEFTKELEAPHSFFYWAAIAGIAGACRDKIYISQGPRNTYPNLFILLLADSAVSRKSVPSGLIADILQELRLTKVIRGRTSIQATLQDLAAAEMDKTTGKILTGGSCILCAEELASFIVQDPAAIPILTDIYDYRAEWTTNLKGTGKMTIKSLCVSMLAASNETHLREVYNTLAIYGGLLGRTLFIKPDERRPPNPLFGEEELIVGKLPTSYDKKKLKEYLIAISQFQGKMMVTSGARDEYNKWYRDLHAHYGERSDKSGVIARIHTSVTKVAMCLAIGHTYEMVINQCHIEEAIDECTKLLPNYNLFVMASGKTDIASAGAIMFNALWDDPNHCVSRKLFLRKHWTEVDSELLDKLIVTIESAGLITSTISQDADQVYRLTDIGISRLKDKVSQNGNGA
jgi:hypothetical protein